MPPAANLWRCLHAILILGAIPGGYHGVRWPRGSVTLGWFPVALGFVIFSIAPLLLVAYGFLHSRKETIRRPTWDRNCFRWWTDTLQPLRLSVVLCLAQAVGGAFALHAAGERGRMWFHVLAAIAAGIFIGERLVYAIYRRRIV